MSHQETFVVEVHSNDSMANTTILLHPQNSQSNSSPNKTFQKIVKIPALAPLPVPTPSYEVNTKLNTSTQVTLSCNDFIGKCSVAESVVSDTRPGNAKQLHGRALAPSRETANDLTVILDEESFDIDLAYKTFTKCSMPCPDRIKGLSYLDDSCQTMEIESDTSESPTKVKLQTFIKNSVPSVTYCIASKADAESKPPGFLRSEPVKQTDITMLDGSVAESSQIINTTLLIAPEDSAMADTGSVNLGHLTQASHCNLQHTTHLLETDLRLRNIPRPFPDSQSIKPFTWSVKEAVDNLVVSCDSKANKTYELEENGIDGDSNRVHGSCRGTKHSTASLYHLLPAVSGTTRSMMSLSTEVVQRLVEGSKLSEPSIITCGEDCQSVSNQLGAFEATPDITLGSNPRRYKSKNRRASTHTFSTPISTKISRHKNSENRKPASNFKASKGVPSFDEKSERRYGFTQGADSVLNLAFSSHLSDAAPQSKRSAVKSALNKILFRKQKKSKKSSVFKAMKKKILCHLNMSLDVTQPYHTEDFTKATKECQRFYANENRIPEKHLCNSGTTTSPNTVPTDVTSLASSGQNQQHATVSKSTNLVTTTSLNKIRMERKPTNSVTQQTRLRKQTSHRMPANVFDGADRANYYRHGDGLNTKPCATDSLRFAKPLKEHESNNTRSVSSHIKDSRHCKLRGVNNEKRDSRKPSKDCQSTESGHIFIRETIINGASVPSSSCQGENHAAPQARHFRTRLVCQPAADAYFREEFESEKTQNSDKNGPGKSTEDKDEITEKRFAMALGELLTGFMINDKLSQFGTQFKDSRNREMLRALCKRCKISYKESIGNPSIITLVKSSRCQVPSDDDVQQMILQFRKDTPNY